MHNKSIYVMRDWFEVSIKQIEKIENKYSHLNQYCAFQKNLSLV